MNKKILYSLKTVLILAETLSCKDLHHTNKQLHDYDEVCFAEYELAEHIHTVREYLKSQLDTRR